MRIWMAIALVGCGPTGPPVSSPEDPYAAAAPSPDLAPGLEVAPGAEPPPGVAAARGSPGSPGSEPASAPGIAGPDPASGPDPALASPGRGPRGERPARGSAPAGKPTAPSSEAQQLVDAHNRVRAKHCAKPLAWSAKLAQVAQQWANALREKGCAFGHSGGNFGENLAAGTSGTLDAEDVVKMWYDEVAHYRFPGGGFSAQTGHFTQVVWRGTARVGCGRSQCNGMDIWVCEYDPAGNWQGQYRENVLPAGCR